MLKITVPGKEIFNERTNEFVCISKPQTLQLEHSLVSISKWESKWHKPFLSREEKTYEQVLDYIRYMTITQNVKPEVYDALTQENIREITEYIDDSMTATFFSNDTKKGKNSRKIVTSELIYYWMIALQIPFECEKWHLNRLITLIKVCEAENMPRKKRSKKEIMSRNAALNAARKRRLNTKG